MSDGDRNEALRRKLAYKRELSKVGGPFEFAAWAFTLTGLIMVFCSCTSTTASIGRLAPCAWRRPLHVGWWCSSAGVPG